MDAPAAPGYLESLVPLAAVHLHANALSGVAGSCLEAGNAIRFNVVSAITIPADPGSMPTLKVLAGMLEGLWDDPCPNVVMA